MLTRAQPSLPLSSSDSITFNYRSNERDAPELCGTQRPVIPLVHNSTLPNPMPTKDIDEPDEPIESTMNDELHFRDLPKIEASLDDVDLIKQIQMDLLQEEMKLPTAKKKKKKQKQPNAPTIHPLEHPHTSTSDVLSTIKEEEACSH